MDLDLVRQAAVLVSFPVIAAVVGAVVAAYRSPGPRFVSGVQHFAAGVVLAALVGEIMPELRAEHHLGWSIVGFAAGAALVLALGAYGRRSEAAAEAAHASTPARQGRSPDAAVLASEGPRGLARRTAASAANPAVALPVGMLAAMVIDLLLDGVLVGLGARLGAQQGLILTIALTLEILFLGLSVVGELTAGGVSRKRAILICTGLGLCTAVGAIGAAALLGGISSTAMSAILAFGAAALLYLVVEELLVEAHEEQETVTLGAMFFLGFIVIYILSAFDGA